MDRFRVISDLHLDYNSEYPFSLKDRDIFTVICGDTGGDIEQKIQWIKDNVKRGIVVNGNHMPYGNVSSIPLSERRTMSELRNMLADAFPLDSDVTYLDAEIGRVSKTVDGILFVGSCFYSNFRLTDPIWNPNGSKDINMRCSMSGMNDYKYGYIQRKYPLGTDNEPSYVNMRPDDLYSWFCNAFTAIEKILCENESKPDPLPAVLVTHYPLITDYLAHNYYLEQPSEITSIRDFILGSYASDMKYWLKRHPSLKCYCSGHIHDVEKDYRYYSIKRQDMDDLLLVHNVRGYVHKGHARWFNPDTFVNTSTWTCTETELSEKEENERKSVSDKWFAKNLAWGIM